MSKQETKNVVISLETDTRLVALGNVNDTRDSVIQKLLGETWHIAKLKAVLESASQKLEEAKQTGVHSLATQAGSELIQALEQFIKAIESRQKK